MLTGGSLLVGAVGRTDLLGADNAPAFSAAMYRSLHEVILPHEDSVAVYPTHGAGSLCSTGIGSTTWSTIGYERRHDPLLAPMEVDAFARALLAGQPAFPRYFARMRPINQAGPRLLGGVIPRRPGAVRGGAGRASWPAAALVVDARRPAAHAAGHIPGSLSIPVGVVVRDVARLGRGPRSAARPRRRRRRRPRRAPAPGVPDRPRVDRRAPRRRVRGLAGGRAADRVERPSRRPTAWPRPLAAGPAPIARSSSMSARPPSTRPGHVPGAVHIGGGLAARPARRAAARPADRRDLRLRLPRVGGAVDPAGGRVHGRRPGSRTASMPGRRPAIRSRPAPRRRRRGPPPTARRPATSALTRQRPSAMGLPSERTVRRMGVFPALAGASIGA